MTRAEELIKKYDIRAQQELTANGDYRLTGKVFTNARMTAKQKQEVTDNIDEIKKILFAEWNAKKQAADERKAKIAAIEGLKEIEDAQEAIAEYNYRFQKSFEGEYAVGGMGVGEAPKVDVEALKQKYPRAAAYLEADGYALKTNYELSAIGTKARERIINEPDNYSQIIDEMNQELKAFTDKHLWD